MRIANKNCSPRKVGSKRDEIMTSFHVGRFNRLAKCTVRRIAFTVIVITQSSHYERNLLCGNSGSRIITWLSGHGIIQQPP